jgi:hypothetical protein
MGNNVNSTTLTDKQERFALALFKGLSQREAYKEAGYSNKTSFPAIDVNASKLAKNTKVLLRLSELRKRAEDNAVMDVLERKIKLSKIVRGDIADFLNEDGEPVLIPGLQNTEALKKYVVRHFERGATSVTIWEIELLDPIAAIRELNRMDGYSQGVSEENSPPPEIKFILPQREAITR